MQLTGEVHKWLKLFSELGKTRVTIAVSLTTLAGFLLAGGRNGLLMLGTVTGIFFLAAGSSALNQVQERHYDSRMKRTSNRPLPSGRITVAGALMVGFLYAVAGSVVLLLVADWLTLLFAWLAYLWYNLIYTYLKRVSPHAVIPGSVVGAIPPLVGWTAAGGSLSDPRLVPMLVFFFIWQVPHFYLLVLKYGEEYAAAGYPTLTKIHSATYLHRLIFLWVLATSLVTGLLPFTGLVGRGWLWLGYWLLALLLVAGFRKFLWSGTPEIRPGRYFVLINFFVLGIVLLMLLEVFF